MRIFRTQDPEWIRARAEYEALPEDLKKHVRETYTKNRAGNFDAATMERTLEEIRPELNERQTKERIEAAVDEYEEIMRMQECSLK